MISKFLREQQRYTLKNLTTIFECNEDKIKSIIKKLKEYGILKVVKFSDTQLDLSELQDEEIEIAGVEDNVNKYFYVFTFVGLLTISGRILKIFPKYIVSKEEPLKEFKQILKVIEKYNSKEQIIKIFNDSNRTKSYNILGVSLFLLNDFYENGSYTDYKDIIEENGQGEILWEKTVNETFAILCNQRPYYTELQTKRVINNNNSYIKTLYECILTKVSNELKQADILDLFDITPIELSTRKFDDFGDSDYILYRIEKELEQEFNTRKQLILKVMYTYVANEGLINVLEHLSMFGTNCFNLIWEKTCAAVMNNVLNVKLSQLNFPIPLNKNYFISNDLTLSKLFEKPYWSKCNKCASNTLMPDIITFCQKDDKHYFVILDAKYYCPSLTPNTLPKNQPGIESITKQYLYNLAYKKFAEEHNFDCIKNYFLLPTEKDFIEDLGYVELKMLNDIGLNAIQNKLIPAHVIFEKYLTNSFYDTCGLL